MGGGGGVGVKRRERKGLRLIFLSSNVGEKIKRGRSMASFRTAIIDELRDAERRLADFGLTKDQIIAIRDAARGAIADASPLMPVNAPGTLGYIYGVEALRGNILNEDWVIDRTLGVEAVINFSLGVRIGFQNVDVACDPVTPPMPRSEKGSGTASLCALPLFAHYGYILETDADRLPSDKVKYPLGDQVITYFVMVGEDGSVELSRPIIAGKKYSEFVERIFIERPIEDWEKRIETESDPVDDFEVSVKFKDQA